MIIIIIIHKLSYNLLSLIVQFRSGLKTLVGNNKQIRLITKCVILLIDKTVKKYEFNTK